MQWSRLKRQVMERPSPKLAGRIDFNNAGYRHHHEADGRIWLSVDGAELVSFCTQTHWNRAAEIAEGLVECNGESVHQERRSRFGALGEAAEVLNRNGLLTRLQAREDLESYLNMTVEDALDSDSPLHVALALLDRRLGKRRLRDLELPAWVPSFVIQLLELRRKAEGLPEGRRRLEAPAAALRS